MRTAAALVDAFVPLKSQFSNLRKKMPGAVQVIKAHRHTLTHQAFTERKEFNSFKTLCSIKKHYL